MTCGLSKVILVFGRSSFKGLEEVELWTLSLVIFVVEMFAFSVQHCLFACLFVCSFCFCFFCFFNFHFNSNIRSFRARGSLEVFLLLSVCLFIFPRRRVYHLSQSGDVCLPVRSFVRSRVSIRFLSSRFASLSLVHFVVLLVVEVRTKTFFTGGASTHVTSLTCRVGQHLDSCDEWRHLRTAPGKTREQFVQELKYEIKAKWLEIRKKKRYSKLNVTNTSWVVLVLCPCGPVTRGNAPGFCV